MVFSSTIFLFLFLPVVLIGYYNPIVKNRKFRNIFLLVASLGFYAWGEPVFVFLMCFSIFVTYIFGNLVDKENGKKWLVVGIIYHVAVLFVFKYLTFFASELGLLFNFDSGLNLELPIGISFFTFQMMSYLFDVYYGKAKAQKNPLYVGLYISLFPQLIAGPIVRYENIANEINERHESFEDVVFGVERFIYGLGKKVLLSNYLAYVADMAFSMSERSVGLAWIGAICYTYQIYFDFSGYSDMAIGLGRMFGFHFLENFNYPYISRSVTEFWRRWHISLSSWFRDYVYIPLGGNRKGRKRQFLNLFVVWLLTGIWHGANWTFIIWGLFYFVVLLFEKMLNFANNKKWQGIICTFVIVNFAWVMFRAESLAQGFSYILSMFGIGSVGVFDEAAINALSNVIVVLIAAIILSTPIYPLLIEKVTAKNGRTAVVVRNALCLMIFICSLLQMVSATYSPFIYFNF